MILKQNLANAINIENYENMQNSYKVETWPFCTPEQYNWF